MKSLGTKFRDRIRDVIEHKCKFVVFPIVCADHCAYLLNKRFQDVVRDGRRLAEVLEYGYRLYNYDMVLIFSDPYVESEAMGCRIEYSPYPKLCEGIKSLYNKGGGLSRVIKERTIRNISSKSIDRTSEIIKAGKLLKKNVDVPVFVSIKGPFTLASFLAGIEYFLMMVLIDERRAKSYIDMALEFQLGYLKKLLSIGVNIFGGDPMASASVISPQTFEKFAYEPLKILIKQIKSVGMIAGVHICGDTKQIINLLDDLNVDILSIEDITPKAKTLKMGGVSTLTLLNGDKIKIKKEIESAMKEEFLILSTSCDVAINTPVDNIKTMVEFARQYED